MKRIYTYLILVLLIFLLIFSIAIIHKSSSEQKKEVNFDKPIYQGLVRLIDNERYFRETGITKPSEYKE
jgi:type II secretory pathway component PulF